MNSEVEVGLVCSGNSEEEEVCMLEWSEPRRAGTGY